MEFSPQAMIDAWIGASLGRHVEHTGDAAAAAIDAVRDTGRTPRVTIVNWRLRVAHVGRFAEQHETARAAARDTIDAHDPAGNRRRHVPAGGHDLGAPRQGKAAR